MLDHWKQAPRWQRTIAATLHGEFTAMESRMARLGSRIGEELAALAGKMRGETVRDSKGKAHKFPASQSSLDRLYRQWRDGRDRMHAGRKVESIAPRTPAIFIPDYNQGKRRSHRVPPELVAELHRLATMETGGRDKRGLSPFAFAIKEVKRRWVEGEPVEGLGRWSEWYRANHPDEPAPPKAPEFPFTDRALYNHAPPERQRQRGNRGEAAARAASVFIELDYSRLRKSELFYFDDARLDVICIDDRTGQPIEAKVYLAIEAGSRLVPSFICKPADAFRQEDVAELLAHVLQTPGFGLGVGYTTHFVLERGTVAVSETAKVGMEAAAGGRDRLWIHRTGMLGGVRWIGAARDQASGNSFGKAVVERFIGLLHARLLHLPGQRGNNAANQPANLGLIAKGKNGGEAKLAPGSLLDEARKLYKAEHAAALASGERIRLDLGVARFSQLFAAVGDAVKAHNSEPGHNFRGHGTHIEEEIQPGVWARLPSSQLPPSGHGGGNSLHN